MKKVLLIVFSFVFLNAQHFIPLKMSHYISSTNDTLSIYIKSDKKFYHIANFIQMTNLKITNDDTLLSRSQFFTAINTNLKFNYVVDLKANMNPSKIALNSSDSVETHSFGNYDINTITHYSGSVKKSKKSRLAYNGLIFEDNNIDLLLGQLVIEPKQHVRIPMFLTDDYIIEQINILYIGLSELKIKHKKYKARQFLVKGSDFTQYYWISLDSNKLLQYESIEDNIVMIKQNFN